MFVMASIPQDKCPVDHSAVASSSQTDKCPVDHDASSPSSSASADTCPVEHGARSSWTNIFGSQGPAHPHVPSGLPTDREVSSIPRADGTNWVYPSEAQFFAAMARKNHSPQANDMKVIVPIHNAVNERAWAEVMKWESGQGGEKCGGIKLVSFKGRPGDRSPKARWKTLLGYVGVIRSPIQINFTVHSAGTPPHSTDTIGL